MDAALWFFKDKKNDKGGGGAGGHSHSKNKYKKKATQKLFA